MKKKSIYPLISVICIFVTLISFTYVIRSKETEIKSDFFRISKVEQISYYKVVVYFTQPVNTKAEKPEAFSLLSDGCLQANKADLNVSVIPDSPNALTVYFKNFIIKPGIEYTLKVNDFLESAFGVTISLGFGNQGLGDQINFTGKNFDENELKLVNVTTLNNSTIQLDFNKPVNQLSAKKISNYKIVNTETTKTVTTVNAVISKNSFGIGCRVILTTAKLISYETYDITINNIDDVKKQYLIKNKKFLFTVIEDPSITKVVSIEPVDMNTIVVKFNRNLNSSLAKDVSNYVINKGCQGYSNPTNGECTSGSPDSVHQC